MDWKKLVLLISVFIVVFALFNLVPIIPIKYDIPEGLGHPTEKVCSLNYLTCMSSRVGDNFPSFLTTDIFTIFVFPILIPALLTLCTYYFFLKKK